MRARRECSNLIELLRANAELRDRHPDRQAVSGLEHGLQMATRALYAEYTDEWVAVALIHDAAKPLNETFHGQVIAEVVREWASPEAYRFLRGHSVQAYGERPTPFGLLDAASFEPAYPSLSLDALVPYLEKLYGIG